MPDSVQQTLGFDASAAIASVINVNKQLSALTSGLRGLDASATKFNVSGAQLAAVLARIAPQATSAAVAINRLYTAMSQASQVARATGAAAASLSTKFTDANRTANVLRGGLNNVGVGAVRAARGLDSIKTGSLGAVAQQSARAAQAMDRLNASINAQRNPITPPPAPGTRNSNNLVGGLVARYAQYQLLSRAVGELSGAFSFAGRSAVEFDRHVAEIRTISTEKNLDSLKVTVRGLSDSFNRDLGDVAEGYYQTLSNQVGDAAESAKFLATALKFARVSVTDTGSAVNLLAGALHAFNANVDQADNFAAKFFKTIELGRVRGAELANVVGRVATIANQTGVSISELDASIATMTHSGLDAAQSVTQIAGALASLFKPSKAGQEALDRLGFSGGDAAVKALGLQGALKALVGTTDGSIESVARLVPRFRGLSAVLAITGQQGDTYKKFLKEIENASEETLNREYKLQIETNAESVTREVNKLRNAMTAAGEGLLSTANSALKLAGGADTLVTAMQHALPVLELAAAGAALVAGRYVTTTLATTRLATATTALGTSFRFAFGWAGAALVAYEAVTFATDLAAKADARRLKELSDSEEKALDVIRKAAALRIREQEDENSKVLALAARRTAALTQSYNDEISQAKLANDQLVADTKSGFGKLVQAREAFLGKLRSQLDAQKRLEESVIERIDEVRRQRNDDQFEQAQRGKPVHQQIKAHADEAIAAAEQAKTLRSNPDTTEADRRLADRKDQDAQRHLNAARTLHEQEDRAVDRDTKQVGQLAERLRHGQEAVDDAGAKHGNTKLAHGAKRDQQATRRLVQANAARKRQLWNEDFGEESQDANFAIGRSRKVGRLAELRQKTIDAGAKVGREKQDADADQQLLGFAAGEVRKRQDAGNDAQLANVRQSEQQLQAAIKKTAEENKRVADLAKQFHTNVSQFDKKGNLLPADKQAEHLQKARAAGAEILGLTLDSKDEALNTKLASLQAEIAKKLTDEEIGHLRLAPDALDGVHEQIQAALDKTKFEFRADIKFASASGHQPVKDGVLDAGELTDGTKASETRLADLQRQKGEIDPTRAEITSYGRQAADLASSAGFGGYRGDAVAKYINRLLGKNGKSGGIYDQHDEFDRLRDDIGRQAHGKAPIDVAGLESRFKRLSTDYGDAGSLVATDQLLGHPGNFKQLAAAIEKLKAKLAAMERLRKNEATTITGQDDLNRLSKDSGARAVGPTAAEIAKRRAEQGAKAAKAAGDESAAINQTTGPAGKLAQYAQWTADGYERAARAMGKIRPPKAPDALKDPNDNIVAAHGGAVRRFATGGGAIGTDTVRAWLTPGEFVVNPQASRNFYSQLVSMNAGSNGPSSYPASHVTNVSDVNLNVSIPYGSSAEMARQLADMTRREIRRRS